jgi:hypothetical protein
MALGNEMKGEEMKEMRISAYIHTYVHAYIVRDQQSRVRQPKLSVFLSRFSVDQVRQT